jgi:hypothetical protein
MMRFHRIILVFWSFGRGYEPRLDINLAYTIFETVLKAMNPR